MRRVLVHFKGTIHASSYMRGLRSFRKLRRSCGRLIRFIIQQPKRRFFRAYAIYVSSLVAILVTRTQWFSYLVFVEIPLGRVRGHLRRVHISTAGVYIYDVDRALESAV